MKKYLSDNDLIFATMNPKEAMEWTGGHDKEKIKHMREVKAAARKQEAANAAVKPREETAVERIERIKYEFNETKKRPPHIDNKKIYSFEDRFKKDANNINDRATPQQVGKLAERLEQSRQMTGYYDKPKKAESAISYMKKPTPPVVDIKQLSNDLNTYIALSEADNNNVNERRLRAIMNEPREDKDIDKGIVSIFGGYPKKYI